MELPVKRIAIVPYKLYSASAKALRSALRQAFPTKRVLLVSTASTKYQPRWTDYVINWGCSNEWPWINNTPKLANKNCVNKLRFFEMVSEYNKTYPEGTPEHVRIPKWTTSTEQAVLWCADDKEVFARTKLDGHSGAGIVPCLERYGTAMFPHAPLYVMYKKKRHEYRVHVFKNDVIDVTQKKKRKEAEHLDTKIRNHKNGWVYCRENVQEPTGLRTLALNAIRAADLTFGAVDIIWNEKEDKCYVLEINTAPGLVGTTLDKYVDSFVKDIKNVG